MTASARPHTRARAQLLLGLLPVLVVGVGLLVLLALRLGSTQAPLAAAGATASVTVARGGLAPDGRGVEVTFADDEGEQRTGRLVLRAAAVVDAGTAVTVQYDPSDPSEVYADGDAAHAAVADVLFGLVLVALVVLAVGLLTGWRLLSRPRWARRPPTRVTATHVVVRQGLLVRSWLELGTARGLRWVPVHWAPELDRLRADTAVEVHGDPTSSARVLPVVAGQQVWPSGRVRRTEPRGSVRQAPLDPDAGPVPLTRQVRGDLVVVVVAPVLGLLWAYVDGSGAAGFAVASVLAAAVLFWAPQLLGSTPSGLAERD